MQEKGSHMSPEEFRRQGYAVVDWLVDYQKRVAELPVLSRVAPGEIRAALPPLRQNKEKLLVRFSRMWTA